MKLNIIATLLFAVTLAALASAADINGKWQAKMAAPMGDVEVLFDFRSDGDKLTGTVSNALMGQSKIQEGKINGDQITFKQVMERRRTITFVYSGKVKDGEIEFTRQAEGSGGPGGGGPGGRRGRMGGKVSFTAKRAPEGASLELSERGREMARFARGPGRRGGFVRDPEMRETMLAAREKYDPREGRLRTGDLSPDFNLKVQNSDEWVRLSDFRGNKPVALVFGSYT